MFGNFQMMPNHIWVLWVSHVQYLWIPHKSCLFVHLSCARNLSSAGSLSTVQQISHFDQRWEENKHPSPRDQTLMLQLQGAGKESHVLMKRHGVWSQTSDAHQALSISVYFNDCRPHWITFNLKYIKFRKPWNQHWSSFFLDPRFCVVTIRSWILTLYGHVIVS